MVFAAVAAVVLGATTAVGVSLVVLAPGGLVVGGLVVIGWYLQRGAGDDVRRGAPVWAASVWAVPQWVWVAACVVVVALGVGGRASAAWEGLDTPVPDRIEGTVQLTKDPRPVGRSIRVEIRHESRRYDLFASGSAAGELGRLRAGERTTVSAAVSPRESTDRWRASRHVAGTASASFVGEPQPAAGPWRFANAVHRTLGRGSDHLPPSVRGLARAVSVGDRGALPALASADLRSAGLSHLTAMSGQHVAMLMVLVAPIIRRLGGTGRVAAVAVVLSTFVIISRGEPSILRAVLMAMVVEVTRVGGNRVHGARALAIAVAVLVIIDPLIVWSVAFQLSVCATLGICIGASAVAASIPGPRAVASVLAMGVCAQLAVAPVAIGYFGSLPVTGVVASAVASPAVGLLLGWSLTVGMVAGSVDALSGVLHVPTRFLANWVLGVSSVAGGLGLGHVQARHAVGLGACGGVAFVASRFGHARIATAARVAMAVVVAAAALFPAGPAPGHRPLGAGAELIAGDDYVVVVADGRARAAGLVGSLRAEGVVRVHAVVLRTGSSAGLSAAAALCDRMGPCVFFVPAAITGVGDLNGWVHVVDNDVTASLGGLLLRVGPDAGGGVSVGV